MTVKSFSKLKSKIEMGQELSVPGILEIFVSSGNMCEVNSTFTKLTFKYILKNP